MQLLVRSNAIAGHHSRYGGANSILITWAEWTKTLHGKGLRFAHLPHLLGDRSGFHLVGLTCRWWTSAY